MTTDRVAELEQTIASANAELARIKEEARAESIRRMPVESIADLLHRKQCRLDHTDQCGWLYDEELRTKAMEELRAHGMRLGPRTAHAETSYHKHAVAVMHVAGSLDPVIVYRILDAAL